jgi:Transcriptional regulator
VARGKQLVDGGGADPSGGSSDENMHDCVPLRNDVSGCRQLQASPYTFTAVAVITRLDIMARWEPGARERLQEAALELFASRGFEQTTAAEIAQSVGLTERTFFRHFSDKREVLFDGQELFLQTFLDGVDATPPEASPLEIIASALQAAAALFRNERRPHSRMRQSVIDQNPALRERELHKFAGLATAVAEALRSRGVTEPAASLAAESGATVFGIAFAQWIHAGEDRSLTDITAQVLQELRTVTGAAIEPRSSPVTKSRP